MTGTVCLIMCGECCKIYTPDNMPCGVWFDEWCIDWQDEFDRLGITIPPLHNPLLSHACFHDPVVDAHKASIPDWVDIDRCQYSHPTDGCMVPREQRPAQCLEYLCSQSKQRLETK